MSVESGNFTDKLLSAARMNHSFLCIGLDPDPALMPDVSIVDFNRAIIESTSDLVCAFKPNLAFYEALGPDGFDILTKSVEAVPSHIPIIGDAKRGDIGNTARMYAKAMFSIFNFDAVTVNPYLGADSLQPFLDYHDRGIFIVCRTSNPGSTDFQSLECLDHDKQPLYLKVAEKAKEWNKSDNVGLVVAATFPEELKQVRSSCPDMPLLIPGVGTQGGNLSSAICCGVDRNGEKAIIISSRQVIYASKGSDFAQEARKVAGQLRDQINRICSESAS